MIKGEEFIVDLLMMGRNNREKFREVNVKLSNIQNTDNS